MDNRTRSHMIMSRTIPQTTFAMCLQLRTISSELMGEKITLGKWGQKAIIKWQAKSFSQGEKIDNDIWATDAV